MKEVLMELSLNELHTLRREFLYQMRMVRPYGGHGKVYMHVIKEIEEILEQHYNQMQNEQN